MELSGVGVGADAEVELSADEEFVVEFADVPLPELFFVCEADFDALFDELFVGAGLLVSAGVAAVVGVGVEGAGVGAVVAAESVGVPNGVAVELAPSVTGSRAFDSGAADPPAAGW